MVKGKCNACNIWQTSDPDGIRLRLRLRESQVDAGQRQQSADKDHCAVNCHGCCLPESAWRPSLVHPIHSAFDSRTAECIFQRIQKEFKSFNCHNKRRVDVLLEYVSVMQVHRIYRISLRQLPYTAEVTSRHRIWSTFRMDPFQSAPKYLHIRYLGSMYSAVHCV